jgi:hypothetical protein
LAIWLCFTGYYWLSVNRLWLFWMAMAGTLALLFFAAHLFFRLYPPLPFVTWLISPSPFDGPGLGAAMIFRVKSRRRSSPFSGSSIGSSVFFFRAFVSGGLVAW